MATENNIPAYPQVSDWADDFKDSHQGMTLLDHFAGLAMPAMMNHIDCKNDPGNVAYHAYQYAAAMIEERKKYIA